MHLYNFMTKVRMNCSGDSHAISSSSCRCSRHFFFFAHLICQHADESQIGWMNIHWTWAGCLRMPEGLVFIPHRLTYLCSARFSVMIYLHLMLTATEARREKLSRNDGQGWRRWLEKHRRSQPHYWICEGQISVFWRLAEWRLIWEPQTPACPSGYVTSQKTTRKKKKQEKKNPAI